MRVIGTDGTIRDAWGACGRKRTYMSRKDAKRAARRYGQTPYRCPVCGLWHLTSHWRRPQGRDKMGIQLKGAAMKLESWNDDEVRFSDGTVVTYDHLQDCCECNWADFSVLELAGEFGAAEFDGLGIEPIDGAGFNLVPIRDGEPVAGLSVFVPCYSDQNGCYSDELTIIVTRPGGSREETSLAAEERLG